jgi:glutamyl-tRNA reductase
MPTITSLREHGADIVDRVLAENAGRWETASPRDLARIEAVARAVMQRLLHEPTIRLKESGHARQQVLRELFGLEDPPSEAPADEATGLAPPADNVRPLKRRA